MKLLVGRDIDGFFGLFVDNLVQLLLIIFLCTQMAAMRGEASDLITQRILPGAAISILIGNLFYSYQAYRLARREGRHDVTALPYGINTPSVIVYVFFVLAPIAQGDPAQAEKAWRMGLIACLGSGIIEFLGAFIAPAIRRSTPRAALLSTLAGIAIGFISMSFALEIWARPVVTMTAAAIVFASYFGGIRFPFHLPGGLLALLIGSALAWTPLLIGRLLGSSQWDSEVGLSFQAVAEASQKVGLAPPIWCGREIWELLQSREWIPYLSVIIPMGIFNVIGSLQNIESAEAAGDRYSVRTSLAANGLGTIAAALLGSCFPTTIYIGHPGWKQMGARSGYSVLNGIVISAICLSGAVTLINAIIPQYVGYPIVLWIGVIITAQAFAASPTRHAAAVAIGLFPAIAAWGATVAMGAFNLPAVREAGVTLESVLTLSDVNSVNLNGFALHGMIVLERGYIFTCMALAAISAALIDRKYFTASLWSAAAVILTVLGFIHAYSIKGNALDYRLLWDAWSGPPTEGLVYNAYDVAAGYLAMTVVFIAVGYWQESRRGEGDPSTPDLYLS